MSTFLHPPEGDIPVTHRTYKAFPTLDSQDQDKSAGNRDPESFLSSILESLPDARGHVAQSEQSQASIDVLEQSLDLTTRLPDVSRLAESHQGSAAPSRPGTDLVLRAREMAWSGSAETNGAEYVLNVEIGHGGM